MLIGDEVADQVDAERPLCECLRLPDKMAQDIGGLMSAPIVPSPPASQTAAARAGRAIIAMPALTIGVVSPKVRVMDVENISGSFNRMKVTGAVAPAGECRQDDAATAAVEALFDTRV